MAGVIYSINGVNLHDAARGWRVLRGGTSTQGGVTNSLNKVPIPGRPGFAPAPYTFTEQAIVFVVQTARAGLEPLLNLAAVASTLMRSDDATRVARVQLASAIPSGEYPLDGKFDVTITLIAYDGVWRDVEYAAGAEGLSTYPITSPSQSLTLLDGIGAPVWDFSFALRGAFGNMQITDAASGSWIKTVRNWPGTVTHCLLYLGSTGQAFLSNESSPWVPVSDATQYIDVSGNGGFRLTPEMVSGNPSNRQARLNIITTAQTSTVFRIRAKRAYRMN